MTLGERKAVAEGWVRAARGRLEVVVHVGTNCTKDSQELVGCITFSMHFIFYLILGVWKRREPRILGQ